MKYIVYLSQRPNRTYPYILKNWPKPGHSSHLRKIPLSLRTVQSPQLIQSKSIIQLCCKIKTKETTYSYIQPNFTARYWLTIICWRQSQGDCSTIFTEPEADNCWLISFSKVLSHSVIHLFSKLKIFNSVIINNC